MIIFLENSYIWRKKNIQYKKQSPFGIYKCFIFFPAHIIIPSLFGSLFFYQSLFKII